MRNLSLAIINCDKALGKLLKIQPKLDLKQKLGLRIILCLIRIDVGVATTGV